MLDVLAARIPSYNVNREPISDAATLVRPANLRGLPADSTLILVNGKRRHRGAVIGEFVSGINKGAQGVDIAPLTPMALQRVEVLRDGASAQYGSDAIAGVINFVLEDDPEVRRVQLQYGSTFAGDGDQTTVAGSFGTRLGRDGFATISAELRDSAPTSRGSQDPQATYLIDNGYTSVADPVVIWGSPEVKHDFKVLVNAAAEAGVGELYGFGGWRGSRGDLNYDFSLSAGRNEAVYRIRNTGSMHRTARTRPRCSIWVPRFSSSAWPTRTSPCPWTSVLRRT